MPRSDKFHSFGLALLVAQARAEAGNAAETVCIDVTNGDYGYVAMPSQEYAVLRENRQDHDLTPIFSALPNGTVENHLLPRDHALRRQS